MFDAGLWSSKLIVAVWYIFRDSWNAQKTHLHTGMENESSSILNKQVQKDRLNMSHESKANWLVSVRIIVHDFTVVHKCSPSQQ
eukprot:13823017-Ditylum_brightwellii.AAC.1